MDFLTPDSLYRLKLTRYDGKWEVTQPQNPPPLPDSIPPSNYLAATAAVQFVTGLQENALLHPLPIANSVGSLHVYLQNDTYHLTHLPQQTNRKGQDVRQ